MQLTTSERETNSLPERERERESEYPRVRPGQLNVWLGERP